MPRARCRSPFTPKRLLPARLLAAIAFTGLSQYAIALPPPFAADLEGPPTTVPAHPIRLDENTRYYRGMDERQASLTQMISMLAGQSDSVIPSHRLTTLRRVHPEKTESELRELLDADLAEWRRSGSWFSISDCHSDPFECGVSSFEVLRGGSFPDLSFIPEELRHRVHHWPNSPEPWRLLRPLDPVISTSLDLDVARSFARSQGEDSPPSPARYVLHLNDSRFRHCPADYRAPAEICVIENTEYAEESEMPFWNYILPVEVDAIERGNYRIRRASSGLHRNTRGAVRLFRIERDSSGAEIEKPIPPACLKVPHGTEAAQCPAAIAGRLDSRLLDALRAAGVRLAR